jgi:hypothetical protein
MPASDGAGGGNDGTFAGVSRKHREIECRQARAEDKVNLNMSDIIIRYNNAKKRAEVIKICCDAPADGGV